MGERIRSRDPRNNSNKCYVVFFKDENNSRENIISPPKKRESPTKKKTTMDSVIVGDVELATEAFKDTTAPKTAPVEVKHRDEATGDLMLVLRNEVDHVVPPEVKSESFDCNKRKIPASEFDFLQTEAGDVQIKKLKLCTEKDQMFETFQPWALRTYGDQAKTKTITRRKKHRILKALDGKEHNNPDSSKFRFWVKSKGFTIQRPESFCDTLTARTVREQDTPKDQIDLFVASTIKDFRGKTYRKVAVVEDFFEIIYSVHVELGGRSGRHAGQKRTYRIITETYAFLPREAVTKFLSSCPACKKNLRPFTPLDESSSDYEALNYSSQTDSSLDSTQLGPIRRFQKQSKAEGKTSPLVTNSCFESLKPTTTCDIKSESVNYSDEFSTKLDISSKLNETKTAISAGSSPNYYQFLKKFCTIPSSHTLTPKLETECDRNSSTTTKNDNLDLIDLTINQANSININIGNNQPTQSLTKPEKDVFINSVDVSINMSSSSNELKILCKTTPPKKRYSVFIPSAPSPPPIPPSTSEFVEESCAINLNKNLNRTTSVDKNNVASLERNQVDLRKVKPITSTYLRMTRSFGLSDEDALKIDDLVSKDFKYSL